MLNASLQMSILNLGLCLKSSTPILLLILKANLLMFSLFPSPNHFQSKFNVRKLKINRQKRNTHIICDSQRKNVKPFLLDPSRNTKVLTFRGMELSHLYQRLAATEQSPNENVSRVVLFLGGNDPNKMKSNYE